MSLAVDLQNRPEDPSLLAQLPSWARYAEQKITKGQLGVKFRVEKAPRPEELRELADRLSGIAGRTVLLEWYFDSFSANIESRIALKLPKTEFLSLWIPEIKTIKILIQLDQAGRASLEESLKKKFKEVNVKFAHLEDGKSTKKGRSFRRLSALLPSGYDWKFEERGREILATHRGKRLPIDYQKQLQIALTRYFDKPLVFEPRFDPSRFKTVALEGCPEGVKILRHALYQTMPGESVGFMRLRAEVPPERREAFEKWVKTIEEEFSIFVDVIFQDTGKIVRAQLVEVARQSGGLVNSPRPIASLIRHFHGWRPPRPPEQEDRNPIIINPENWQDRAFVTIDAAGTRDPEDGVCAEWVVPGEIARVRVVKVDASSIAFPGSKIWDYSFRAFQSLYARLPHGTLSVPIFGSEIAYGEGAFLPGQARQAWATEVEIDLRPETRGKILKSRICPVYTSSKAKLSFDETEAILLGAAHLQSEQLKLLQLISLALRDARFKSSRFPRFPRQYHAEMLVEEHMILANSCLGSFAHANRIPVIYRTYSPPDNVLLKKFVAQVKSLGLLQIELDDFRDPQRLNALFSCLLEFGPTAKKLYLEMVQAFFGLADYSLKRRPHLALGVECYGRDKSRYLDGLFNQNALRNFFAGARPFDENLRARVVAHCRRRQRAREIDEGRLYGLGLAEYRAQLVGKKFSAFVEASLPAGTAISVDGFGRGLLREDLRDSWAGSNLRVRYLGFEPLSSLQIFERV